MAWEAKRILHGSVSDCVLQALIEDDSHELTIGALTAAVKSRGHDSVSFSSINASFEFLAKSSPRCAALITVGQYDACKASRDLAKVSLTRHAITRFTASDDEFCKLPELDLNLSPSEIVAMTDHRNNITRSLTMLAAPSFVDSHAEGVDFDEHSNHQVKRDCFAMALTEVRGVPPAPAAAPAHLSPLRSPLRSPPSPPNPDSTSWKRSPSSTHSSSCTGKCCQQCLQAWPRR
jgi:hypothetical protein